MKYWPQQLNFAVFCATQGCGISREIFDRGLSLTPQIRAFYQFHVYFTIRRILYQLGGIQNMSALPRDPTFNPLSNHYNVASYKRICAEFGINPSSDFRFTHGKNNGLGNVYVYAQGATKTEYEYPGWSKFSDEVGKAIKGDLIYYIEPEEKAATQYDWFVSKTSAGLTLPRLSCINRSIEAFIYCVLGAQVNMRSSILGIGGRAKETQTEFLTLMEDAIRQPDLAQSVQRYQLAVDESKVRLNLAVCPGAWLMPSRMIINTESTVGYNNKLKQASGGMKLGVNNGINLDTKKRTYNWWKEGHPFSSPEAALLLVSTKNRDLWPCPTPEVRDSRTSRRSAHAQSQVWQIWLVLVSIYCVYKSIQNRNVVGPGQRSRFLVLTKRSAASGNENGGPSKINPPNSHPSNSIHKAIMATQNPKPASKPTDIVLETRTPTDGALEKQTDRETPSTK